jgi:hypothetical protein
MTAALTTFWKRSQFQKVLKKLGDAHRDFEVDADDLVLQDRLAANRHGR